MSVKTLQLQNAMFETNIEELVREDHPYRKILKLLDFNVLCKGLEEECYSRLGKVKTQFQAFMKALIFNTRKEHRYLKLKKYLSRKRKRRGTCILKLENNEFFNSYKKITRFSRGKQIFT